MKVISFNIRGLVSRVKKEELHSLIRKHQIDICCIQETKMENLTELNCREIWGSNNVGWAHRESVGRAGGIAILWNSNSFVCSSSWDMDGAVIINGMWGAERVDCCFISVYAPCRLDERIELWDRLKLIIQQNSSSCLCLVGDFNSIRFPDERVSRSGNLNWNDLREFDDFISDSLLIDLPLQGRKFTCYKPDGSCKSRIDRILINDQWMENWSDSIQKGISRSISDHCPIILDTKRIDWGPKPFRFINAWISHPGFKDFISNCWNNSSIHGWGASC